MIYSYVKTLVDRQQVLVVPKKTPILNSLIFALVIESRPT